MQSDPAPNDTQRPPAKITHFLKSDSGAVTVDWVVITGALVGLGLASIGLVTSGLESQAKAVSCEMKKPIITSSFTAKQTEFVVEFDECLGGLSNAGQGELAYSDGIGADGQPGFLLFTDGPGRDDVVLEPYDSDQSAAFGGTLEWSLKVFDGDTTRWNSVPVATIKGADGVNLDLSRICAAPTARLSHLAFEGQGAFSSQC